LDIDKMNWKNPVMKNSTDGDHY